MVMRQVYLVRVIVHFAQQVHTDLLQDYRNVTNVLQAKAALILVLQALRVARIALLGNMLRFLDNQLVLFAP